MKSKLYPAPDNRFISPVDAGSNPEVSLSTLEKAIVSQQIRTRDLPEWFDFLRHWAALNCLYGEDRAGAERDRLTNFVQQYLPESVGLELIQGIDSSARAIIETPPGDMRRDSSDARFRAKSVELSQEYRDETKPSNFRIARLMGLIYQVRCNLFHGDKNPDSDRDMTLVRSSNVVMRAVVPALEDSIKSLGE